MFWELLATLIAGIAGAGVVLIVNTILGGRLPKWMMPVGAGAAMIAMTIYNEYTWFDRQVEAMPEGLEVAETVENRAWFRPWTQVAPYIHRFVAVDTASLRRHDAAPGQVMADLYLYGRWAPVEPVSVLADCDGRRMAPLVEGVSFAEDGTVEGLTWQNAPEGDTILPVICGEGG